MGQVITLSQNGYGEYIDGPRAQVSRTRILNKKKHFWRQKPNWPAINFANPPEHLERQTSRRGQKTKKNASATERVNKFFGK